MSSTAFSPSQADLPLSAKINPTLYPPRKERCPLNDSHPGTFDLSVNSKAN